MCPLVGAFLITEGKQALAQGPATSRNGKHACARSEYMLCIEPADASHKSVAQPTTNSVYA